MRGFPFKGLLLLIMQNTRDMVQILQSISHNVCPILLPKFATSVLFILTLIHPPSFLKILVTSCDEIGLV